MCWQEMNRCSVVGEQDSDSTPVNDGFSESCQIGFLLFLRMWNVDSYKCGGEESHRHCSHHRLGDVFILELQIRA